MKVYGEYQFSLDSRKLFNNGDLREEWFLKYPMLFNEEDRIIAANQPGYHFFEWLGAIQIYEDLKWLSLIEKYQFKNHPIQREIFNRIVPEKVFETIVSSKAAQAPDLFVYSQDKSDWFFCEVKGLRDRVSKNQAQFFREIESVSKKEIFLLKFIIR